jgi:hypothetical protein
VILIVWLIAKQPLIILSLVAANLLMERMARKISKCGGNFIENCASYVIQRQDSTENMTQPRLNYPAKNLGLFRDVMTGLVTRSDRAFKKSETDKIYIGEQIDRAQIMASDPANPSSSTNSSSTDFSSTGPSSPNLALSGDVESQIQEVLLKKDRKNTPNYQYSDPRSATNLNDYGQPYDPLKFSGNDGGIDSKYTARLRYRGMQPLMAQDHASKRNVYVSKPYFERELRQNEARVWWEDPENEGVTY